jgi:hypothetical protein
VSRFDIDDDGEGIPWALWHHNLTRALASGKGKAALHEFRDALLAVPGHRLIRDRIADLDGDVCAIGAFAAYKRVQKGVTWAEATADLNQEFHPVFEPFRGRDGLLYGENWSDSETDASTTQHLGMAECGLNSTLAWFLGYQNDEGDFRGRSPEEQWQNAYDWVSAQLETPS